MEIEIGKNKTKILLDPEDYHLTIGHTVSITAHGYVALVYYHGKINGKYKYSREYLHRRIMNPPKGLQVDHINGNRLDNRKENLRLCSNGQNNRNKASSSGYKGVHWNKKLSKWVVQITKDYKVHHVGLYTSETAAALAYNEVAKELHGDYAYLNKVTIDKT